MPDINSVEMGACSVKADGVDLGHTAGGTLLRVDPVWRAARDERFGETPVDSVFLGARVSVTVRLLEKSCANLRLAMPHAFPGAGWLGVGRAPGFRAGDGAVELRLHPLEKEDDSDDVVIHRAVAACAVEIPFEEGEERAFELVFTGFIDLEKPDGESIARIFQS